MIKSAFEQFKDEPDTDPKRAFLLTEITLDNLRSDGELDEKDFLDRAELLNALGQTVMISDCKERHKIMEYLSDFKVQRVGMVFGVQELLELVNEKYYQNMDGRLLAAFGELFTKNVKIYVYPAMQEGSEELMSSQNLPIHEGVKFLYKHLTDNKQIEDIRGFNHDILHIFSKEVLKHIQRGQSGWENMVPAKVARIVKDEYLFGYPCEQLEFDY